MFSISSFVLNMTMLATLSPGDFARFGVVQAVTFGGTLLTRPILAEEALIDRRGTDPIFRRALLRRSAAAGVCLGVAVSAICFGLGLGNAAVLWGFVVGLVAPVYDLLRYVAVARNRSLTAIAAGALWMAFLVVLVAALSVNSTSGGLFVWASASGLAVLVLAFQILPLGRGEAVSAPPSAQLELLTDRALSALLPVVLLMVVTGVAGFAEAGSYRAFVTIVSPVYTIGAATQSVVLVGRGDARLRTMSAALAGLALVYGIAILAVLRWLQEFERVPEALDGRALGVALTVAQAAAVGPSVVLAGELRRLGYSRALLRVRLVTVGLSVPLVLVGAWWTGAEGAAFVLATLGIAVSVLYFGEFAVARHADVASRSQGSKLAESGRSSLFLLKRPTSKRPARRGSG
ncbi:MAG: hypothetical protein AAGC53_15785 [Actinomycetota bacterium]